MLFAFVRYSTAMVVAGLAGFTAVHYMVWGLFPWSQESKVTLNVSIRGTRNQPVSGAQIFVYAPQKTMVGFSDSKGEYHGLLQLPRGQVSILEAVGPTYRIRKDLLIPRSRSYTAQVRLDPKEAQLGNMTLLSKALEDMGKNIGTTRKVPPKPMPAATPQVETSAPAQSPPVESAQPATEAALPPTEKAKPPSEAKNGTGNPALKIVASNETPQAVHRMKMLEEVLTGETKGLGIAFAGRGISLLKLRPLMAENEVYYEIIAMNRSNTAVSSIILKGFPLNQETVGNAVRALLRNPAERTFDVGTLTVYTSRPSLARAYLNGTALPRRIIDGAAHFQLTKIPTNATHGALAVTADERPLIRKVVLTNYLKRDIQWSLPEPALSRR